MALHPAEAFRRAGWISDNPNVQTKYLQALYTESQKLRSCNGKVGLLSSVQAFKDFIENNPVILEDFNKMFEEATSDEPPRDYQELILMLNLIFREAPRFGSFGPPVYMLMAKTMNTKSGFSVYSKEEMNFQFKKMFETWTLFLTSRDSRSVITTSEGGWLCSAAQMAMMREYDGATFEEVFICDPEDSYYGFTSYEDFFTRRFRNPQKHRPTGPPGDLRAISAPCESTVYAYQTNVGEADELYIKDEAYSLIQLLDADPYTNKFIGGSVLQGFLNTTGYHRWHSPVNGWIRKIVDVPGTYFLQAENTLNSRIPPPESDDPPPYLRSLRYFAHTAARQLIFIEADNPKLGLVCFIAIGMTEISTCQASVYEGQHIVRGDELGTFHFGGSSFALVFKAGANIRMEEEYTVLGAVLRINKCIATIDL
ncbi:hypothetical protein Clacol_001113 [Clathrus columnatus]|uniref:L-tryptophan decarboxylase PsiD-like domain-containing protein n=1 Tax=Clathrus columnatus TaxID=1419009 RepID=A0AAV4ZXP7_9AGAM|nr:hypothetical protein Clacol_001113 [Clathrus columnatus]